MQKKLYFLNEEEKSRILNLHESRTKKQYLINEVRFNDGREKYVYFFSCKLDKSNSENPEYADYIYNRIKKNIYYEKWNTKLTGIKTYETFCGTVRAYKNKYENDLFTELDNWISNGYWKEWVETPLSLAIKDFNTNYFPEDKSTTSSFISKLGKSAMKTLTAGFSNYPCVLKNPNSQPVERTNNIKITWKDGKTWVFQPDGTYFKYTDNTLKQPDNPGGGWLYYKCDATGQKIVPIANAAEKSKTTQTNLVTPSGIGMVLITPQQVSSLRTNAGLTGTGNSLSQQDINDLYTLINKLPNKQ